MVSFFSRDIIIRQGTEQGCHCLLVEQVVVKGEAKLRGKQSHGDE